MPSILTAICAALLTGSQLAFSSPVPANDGLQIQLSVQDGLLDEPIDGHVQLLFAPKGMDPLNDTDVTSSPNRFFGQNVFNFSAAGNVTLSGGSGSNTRLGVYGWPNVSLSGVEAGEYTVQAFLNRYETVKRSDGSIISVRFPCGDGTLPIDGPGSLMTSAMNVTITGGKQTIALAFSDVSEALNFNGTEIGGCSQGNYLDTPTLKYVKIRSKVLSEWWNRDSYIGATVLLPHGYENSTERYPVIYNQYHWTGGSGAYNYSNAYLNADFAKAWDEGIIPGKDGKPDQPTPKLILVTFRHETPLYDDSYGVNTANIGPYGDAINDELIPVIENMFRTIPEPYARIQDGASTGGWIAIANVIFRPDLFGACFSSFPDPLDFHRHQDIPLYTSKNAYYRDDGTARGSIREFVNGTEKILATIAQENHWELSYGTSSRSALQWDVWQAVFGVQGYNNYPLETWNKVTGEIYPEAVEYWKSMDLANYILTNWDTDRNLGEALRGRLFVYVGTWDTYYLNEGVEEFKKRVEAKGGVGWANFTILPEQIHGQTMYNALDFWTYLELVYAWIRDHAPDGKTPLSKTATVESGRGNLWDEVIQRGGRQAAVARQAAPVLQQNGTMVEASVGRWDPGVELEAQWYGDGRSLGEAFSVKQGDSPFFKLNSSGSRCRQIQLRVTGRKIGYVEETRESNVMFTGG
ncbi:hypothetical protein AC578_7836 [Pseudocercospora eumusae]|uniref:Uncharacterized protein n=1 Tax=Pseudocercospora eumusae TaxID=321146 RepID=A0A139HJ50_9PEZI|nr:hypothetical protein AC578_7836 [Pseudocercospora eumusae]